MTIGDNVKAIRNEKKLTQEVLAKQMGISRSYLSDIENNRKNPSSKTIEALAEKLDVSMLYLTTGKKALRDLKDIEKKDTMKGGVETIRLNKAKLIHDIFKSANQEMVNNLNEDIKQLLNTELSFVETVYLSNVIDYLKSSNEEDIESLAAIVRMLNNSFDINEVEDEYFTKEDLLEFINSETEDFKNFLKHRYNYKEDD